MTKVMFVTPDRKTVMQVETTEAIPSAGDIVVAPGGTAVYRIVRRAFILDRVPTDTLIDLSKGQPLSIIVQCAVVPIVESEGVVQ